jgi:hypothetical protein
MPEDIIAMIIYAIFLFFHFFIIASLHYDYLLSYTAFSPFIRPIMLPIVTKTPGTSVGYQKEL